MPGLTRYVNLCYGMDDEDRCVLHQHQEGKDVAGEGDSRLGL